MLVLFFSSESRAYALGTQLCLSDTKEHVPCVRSDVRQDVGIPDSLLVSLVGSPWSDVPGRMCLVGCAARLQSSGPEESGGSEVQGQHLKHLCIVSNACKAILGRRNFFKMDKAVFILLH